ncbi:ABC transporter permease [Catenovulum sp. 2E275]|uniref:ABC transporter permease n=1 Tax=Catenovulum sp. 2E275 TaxID=2980497 RepID=UPI0021D0C328|nr:ABC transporter permease [Catenovulum sp. 2E275]MCU4676931.1 ABC transporter permease [Catenovulum sp. 2E275]
MIKSFALSQKVGLSILSCLFIFAFVQGIFDSTSAAQQNLSNIFSLPNSQYLLGTDQFGRSMYARLGSAIRLSFLLCLLCVFSALALGVSAGIYAAWAQGWQEKVMDFIANTILALPGLVLVLLFAAIAPGSFVVLYLGIAITLWVEYYRVVKAISKSVLASSEIEASRQLGFNWFYIIKRHLWPNLQEQIFTLASFGAATAILTMASVGFVYVGLKPPTAELGLMIVELFPYYADAPWVLLQPLVVLFLLILGFNLLAGKLK